MQVGLAIRDVPVGDLIDLSRRADEAGLHSVWVPESPGDRDAFLVLAAAATSTERIGLATGVTPIPTRNPVQLLMAAMTAQELSHGRFILGLGSGNAATLAKIGIHPEPPLQLTRRAIRFLRDNWTEQIIAVPEAEHLQTKYSAVDRMPLFLAAHNHRMLNLAGAEADGVLLNMIPPDEIPVSIRAIRTGALKRGGNKAFPVIASYVLTVLHDDMSMGRQAARLVIGSFCNSGVFRLRLETRGSAYSPIVEHVYADFRETGDLSRASEAIPDEMVDDFAIVGKAEDLPAGLNRFADAGVDIAILSVFPAPLHLKQVFPPLPTSGLPDAVRSVIAAVTRTPAWTHQGA